MVAYTTTYSLAKPTVGDDEDVWGGYLNGNFDTIESLLKGTTSLTSLSLTGNITFGDNDKAVFGAGSDLVIYHDGTHSNIENGTGSLHIRNNTGGQLKLQAVSGEQSLVANANGSVELYHDNSKKIETQSSGVNITGTAQADRFLADTGGGMLRRYQSTWSYPTHDIIHSGYLSAIGDYVYLKAAGNSGDNHGQLIVADNGIYFGKTNAETGAATNSATAPFDNTTYGYFNSSGLSVTGNVTVSGTVDGRDIASDGSKLDGIEASADVTDTANVTAAGALMTTGGTLTGTLNFGDNVKAQFGASADLAIFHDGSNSYIQEFGTGNLILGAGNAFEVRSSDNVTTGAVFNAYGSVDLNHNGSTKLSTTSTGINVTGTVVADGAQIDLSGTRQLNAQIATSGSGYGAITCVEPSASNLRGLELEGQLLRFGTNAFNQTTSVRRMQINDAGETIFYEDTGADAKMRWNPTSEQLKFEDNVKATFGASDDLQIYHDGSNSYITDAGTGSLVLSSNGFGVKMITDAGDTLFKADKDGANNLYYDNALKLATTSTGIDVTGNVVVSGTVDGVDIASFKSSYDSHNHDGRYLRYGENEFRSNYTRVGYGDSGVGYWHKLFDVTINSSYDDHHILVHWATRYAYGQLYFHAHTDNDTTLDVLNAWIKNESYGSTHSPNYFKYTASGSSATVWIYTPPWNSFYYWVEDALTEGTACNITFYNESTTTQQTSEPSGLTAFPDHTPFSVQNDGSGSSLDADLLDGVHGSSFLRSDTGDDFSGTLNYTPDTGTILSVDGQAILQRMTANGAITIGHDDAVIIAGGDTSVTLNANINNATETVFVGAEGGFVAYAFPNNNTSWSNRKELNWNGTNLTLNGERVITTGDATQDYGLITGSVTLTNDYGALS